jgi:uncharacterized membrane protein
MNFIIKNLLRGLVITVPIAVTVFVIYRTFTVVDRLLGFAIPGVGFVITLAFLILVGVLASSIFFRWFFSLTETIFSRAPIVKIVYSSIKDLVEAFVGDKKRFNRPVLVRFAEGPMGLGFVTRESLPELGLEGHVGVYFPLSYSLSGYFLVLPAERVEALSVESSQFMAFIMSGGVATLPPLR